MGRRGQKENNTNMYMVHDIYTILWSFHSVSPFYFLFPYKQTKLAKHFGGWSDNIEDYIHLDEEVHRFSLGKRLGTQLATTPSCRTKWVVSPIGWICNDEWPLLSLRTVICSASIDLVCFPSNSLTYSNSYTLGLSWLIVCFSSKSILWPSIFRI